MHKFSPLFLKAHTYARTPYPLFCIIYVGVTVCNFQA